MKQTSNCLFGGKVNLLAQKPMPSETDPGSRLIAVSRSLSLSGKDSNSRFFILPQFSRSSTIEKCLLNFKILSIRLQKDTSPSFQRSSQRRQKEANDRHTVPDIMKGPEGEGAQHCLYPRSLSIYSAPLHKGHSCLPVFVHKYAKAKIK